MSIFDKYDLVDVDESIKIPQSPEFGLTLLVGSSGTGKTTIMKSWGMLENQEINQGEPVYKLFESESSAEHFLILAGLRSIPCWRRPLSNLSNGEKHRAEIALKLSKGEKFIDEFTSLVDRNTARALCHSINKLENKNLVLATCHKDVLHWLDFDQAYDTDSCQWLDRGSLPRYNMLSLQIKPALPEEIWTIFKRHHYLSGNINNSANCWIALLEGKPVAMTSVIAFPNGNMKNAWRGHRTVVLPEFQGMGIGSALSDHIAEYLVKSGHRYFSKTSHPALGEHREKSNFWKPTSKNKKKRNDYSMNRKTKEDGHKMQHAHRICYSHEYVMRDIEQVEDIKST